MEKDKSGNIYSGLKITKRGADIAVTVLGTLLLFLFALVITCY